MSCAKSYLVFSILLLTIFPAIYCQAMAPSSSPASAPGPSSDGVTGYNKSLVHAAKTQTIKMAFTGTLDKCKACDKTVYVVDMLSIEGMPYHKYCFKCSHCKGTLVMSNYSSMDGVLYCKTHFEQLFKESGNFSKNFQTTGKSEKQNDLNRAPSKLSSMFCGTQDKCSVCEKTVYPLEKVSLEGECYHKTCFRCAHGGCPLTHSSYAALDGVLYCKHHFAQLFMEKGTYSHVLEAAANHKRSTSNTPPVDSIEDTNNEEAATSKDQTEDQS